MDVSKKAGQATFIRAEFVATPSYNPYHFEKEDWGNLFPGDVIVKCAHCKQWGARKTSCRCCGAAID